MTIDDQIGDEKLQYDINREAAKISALSSGKIQKYEYLTGEDILTSNQQKIIEQAKFTYSPLEKAFEKQIKTIEDLGRKQVDALKVLEQKAIESGSNNKLVITKEIFNKVLEERMDEILEISREIDYNNLVYEFKGPTPSINFTIFAGSMYTYNHLKKSEKTIQQVEEEQKYFLKDLNEIASKNPKHNSEKQSYTIKNVRNLHYSRQKVVYLLNDNSKFRSEDIYKSKQNETKGKGLKI